jgi:hypothetical protein
MGAPADFNQANQLRSMLRGPETGRFWSIRGAGDGARLLMLVLHDAATCEYAYGPAQGLADTKVGTFTRRCTTRRRSKEWTVISMKNDWKRIFAFE